MKVLLIGGSRFIGPYIVKELIKNRHNITIFNRGQLQTKYHEKVKFVHGDRNTGFNIHEHFDVVIDTCSYVGSHVKKVLDELNFDFLVNVGTAASYKKTHRFPLDETDELGSWPLFGTYNDGKVECEKVLKKSRKKFAIIRPVYILGQKELSREHFIFSKLKKKEAIAIPGNGQAVIQFVFVQDVAKAIVKIAENRIAGAFNCAGDEFITVQGLVEEMAKIAGVKPLMRFNANADMASFDKSEFPFANENFVCRNEKIKKLGIKFTPLVNGLKTDYLKYYKKVV